MNNEDKKLPKMFLLEGDLTKSFNLLENKNQSLGGIFYLADDVKVVEIILDTNK